MTESFIKSIELDVPLSSIPYADEWLGAWAMHESNFDVLSQSVQQMSIKLHLASDVPAQAAASDKPKLIVGDGGIATIPIIGTMQKQRSSMSMGTSTVEARRLIRAAAADPEVKGIFLLFDTPGGTVAGTGELASDIAKAREQKPVYGFADDFCASAGYWALAQCSKVFTNATGVVGSIGTYSVVSDYSAQAALRGVKVHVIRAGANKGAGQPGTEITAAHLAEWQRRIDAINEQFLLGVASGRAGKLTLDQVRTIADGGVHVGQQAVDKKLVDAVSSAEDAIAELMSIASARKPKGTRMTAATLPQLKEACPGASSDFLLGQLEANATAEAAAKAWTVQLAKDRDAAVKAKEEAEKKAADAEAKAATAKAEANKTAAEEAKAKEDAEKAKAGKPGNDPIVGKGGKATTASSGGDPVVEFSDAVAERMKLNGGNRRAAINSVCKAQPDLHRAMLEATNPGRKTRELIADRFDT